MSIVIDLSFLTEQLDRIEANQQELIKLIKPEPEPEQPTELKSVKLVTFDNHPVGKYTDAMLKSDWGGGNLYLPNTTQIGDMGGSKMLVSHYPKGTFGRGGGLNQWFEFLKGMQVTEVSVGYDILFESGFDFGLGGKLLGFGFGPVKTVMSGGDDSDPLGGSTVRTMWTASGKMKAYCYNHTKTEEWGSNLGAGEFGQFIRGQKHRIELYVKANDLGNSNGIVEVKQDGKVVMRVDNVNIRVSTSPQFIESFALHTFMGGNTIEWAPDHDQKMGIDNIEIKIGTQN